MKFSSSRGKYTVNFQGITAEKAYAGKKSYKLDVTLEEGGRYDLVIPLEDIPVSAKLKFSGMIWVEECLPKSRAVLGLDFSTLPFQREISGGRLFPWNIKQKEWVKVQADIAEMFNTVQNRIGPGEYWGVKGENTGVFVKRIFLQVFTRDKGDVNRRFIVYIDDLKIEGETCEKEEFEKDVQRRYLPIKEKTVKKVAEWEEIARRAQEQLASLTPSFPEAEKIKVELEKKIKTLVNSADLQSAKKNGWLPVNLYNNLEPFFQKLKDSLYVTNIKKLNESKEQLNQKKFIFYAVKPGEQVLPGTILIPGNITDEIRVTACAGEYEPVSFVIQALSDIQKLEVKAGDLHCGKKRIPSEAIDIKVVKCWYQREGGQRVLVPELLLKDDSLVQVDQEKKISRVRFSLPEGEKHLSYDDAAWPKDRYKQPNVWVANDSEKLQPVSIPANTNKQFWLTVKIPWDTEAGNYLGKISFFSKGILVGEVKLMVTVLPIKLSPPYYTTSICNHEWTYINEERYKNSLQNQLNHGIMVPMSHLFVNRVPVEDLNQLEKSLEIRKQLGMPMDIWIAPHILVYKELAGGRSHKGLTHIEITEAQKKRFLEEFQKYLNLAKKYGIKEIYFHLADEREGKELEAWLPVFDIVRSAGGKVINTAHYDGKTFEIVGGKIDLFLSECGVSRWTAEKWHSYGVKVWLIWYPGGGQANFEVYRRNYGLIAWKGRYDGIGEYLYSLDSAWVEACSEKGEAGDGVFSMVYWTKEGVIDTIEWEGYREGIDDVRYITTLEEAIKEAKKTGKKRNEVEEAERFLEQIDVEYGDLEAIRCQIIEHILKLL